jgi:hypothetical protein
MRWYSFTLKFCIDDITNMKIAVKGYVSCATSQEFITDALSLVREPYTIHRKRQHILAMWTHNVEAVAVHLRNY